MIIHPNFFSPAAGFLQNNDVFLYISPPQAKIFDILRIKILISNAKTINFLWILLQIPSKFSLSGESNYKNTPP